MSNTTSKLVRLLESLIPDDPQDALMLREVLGWADSLRRADVATLSQTPSMRLESQYAGNDLFSLFLGLPSAAKRYFHGLVEAMDIYQSIHGESVTTEVLSANAPELSELKRIRDMCLEDGLRSIY
jgi:hypothetical protein